jgi:hypothetical protein
MPVVCLIGRPALLFQFLVSYYVSLRLVIVIKEGLLVGLRSCAPILLYGTFLLEFIRSLLYIYEIFNVLSFG